MIALVLLLSVTTLVSTQLYPFHLNPYWAYNGRYWSPFNHGTITPHLYPQNPGLRFSLLPAEPVGVVAPHHHSSQYHAQDQLGGYTYGYVGSHSSKSESKQADGSTIGTYSYLDADGKLQTVRYTADATHGFRIQGTNLPVAPEHHAKAPEPVKDTAEVAAAKAEFQQAFSKAVTGNAIQINDNSHALPQPVEDTAEVKQAKAEFARLYAEAAAASSSSSDHHRQRRSASTLVPAVAGPKLTTVSFTESDEPTPADTRRLTRNEHQHLTVLPAYHIPHFHYPHVPGYYAPALSKNEKADEAEQEEGNMHPVFYNSYVPPMFYYLHNLNTMTKQKEVLKTASANMHTPFSYAVPYPALHYLPTVNVD